MTVEELYQEELLELAKDTSHRGELKGFTHRYKGKNPICGDVVEVFIKVSDGVAKEVSFVGQGCAISQASAALMADKLTGKTLHQFKQEIQNVSSLLASKNEREENESDDVARILGGVKKFPTRLRCALLSWKAAEIALEEN